jgi:hypothetical protein
MKRSIIIAACVLLSAPAWSQSPPLNSDYGPGSDRRDMRGDRDGGGFRDDRGRRFGLDRDDDKGGDRGWRRGGQDGAMGGGMGGGMGGMGGGARFMLKSGDTQLAVRCDSQESMRACVDATLSLMDKARSLAVPAAPAPAPAR